jgi:hypothetical protein
MRLKSELWAMALLRRCEVQGCYGAILRRGAPEAGAIYVLLDKRERGLFLYGPPPGPSHDAQGRRLWELVRGKPFEDAAAARQYLERTAAIDPDLWVVEIDDPRDRLSAEDL